MFIAGHSRTFERVLLATEEIAVVCSGELDLNIIGSHGLYTELKYVYTIRTRFTYVDNVYTIYKMLTFSDQCNLRV